MHRDEDFIWFCSVIFFLTVFARGVTMNADDDAYGPKTHPTDKLVAVRPPTPIVTVSEADEDEDDAKGAITKVECPLCRGCGLVNAEERAVWMKEHAR